MGTSLVLIVSCTVFGEIQRQTGAGKDDVDTFLHRGFDKIGKIRQRHHDVYAKDPLCLLSRQPDLLFQRLYIGLKVIGIRAGIGQTNAGCCDNADAAFVRDSGGKIG